MRGPRFLSVQHILYLHEDVLSLTPDEPGDLLDLGKLESAVYMPQQSIGDAYLHTDLFEVAAAYCFYLAKAHPFLAGNKRVAAYTAVVFLSVNGIELDLDPKAFGQLVLDVVQGTAGKAELAEFFRKSKVVT